MPNTRLSLGDWVDEPEALRRVYELSMQRLIEADSKMWQVPGLSLTAQAFLLTIALGSQNYTLIERLVAALLGAAVAVASIQLMRRHMFHASCDRVLLEQIEAMGVVPPMVLREGVPGAPHAKGLARLRSTLVWVAAMWAFVLVDALAAAYALAGR
jgi:hypothetical protein